MAKDSIKRLYVQNVDFWTDILSSGKFSDRKLGVKVVDRGIILPTRKFKINYPDGVYDKDFNFVAGYTRINPIKDKKTEKIHIDPSNEIICQNIVQLDEDVIFGGLLSGHIGHFMMEDLCRFWYIVKHSLSNGGGSKILVAESRFGYKPWFDDFFRLMGVDKERIIYVKQPTQCRSITIPDQSEYRGDFTKEWLIPFQAIKSRVTPAEPKKLYLTRTQLGKKNANIHNEEYFEDFFAQRGFEVVAPEKLSIEEQISLIMGADEIAATLGTLTHWAIFCKPTAKFIMFPRTKKEDGNFQRIINNIFLNYYIVDVSKNFMYTHHTGGNFLIGSTKYWKEFVADYFGETIAEDDDYSYLEVALDKYVNFWCRDFIDAEDEHFDKVVGTLKKLCARIIALERKYIEHTSVHLKEFVADYFGETTAENDDISYFGAALEKYIDSWCRKYVHAQEQQGFRRIVDALRELCTRISTLDYKQIKNRSVLTYQTHVDKSGWGMWNTEEQISNLIDQKRDIQAVKIKFPDHKIYYSVYYNETEGWSQEVSDGTQAGTTGKRKAIFGIKIRIDDSGGVHSIFSTACTLSTASGRLGLKTAKNSYRRASS